MTLLEQLQKQFEEKVQQIKNIESLDDVEQFFFSRKSGALTTAMKALKDLTDEERKIAGAALNEIKTTFETHLSSLRATLSEQSVGTQIAQEQIDVTQPLFPAQSYGHKHPISIVRDELDAVAQSMGFSIIDGPELDSDYYNFTAVNIPPNHPARDMQDTLYIKDHPNLLMRTHVSNMQVRLMRQYGAPFRTAYPGTCFRNEATDARHEHTFHQWEAFVVDKNLSIADMKGVIIALLEGLFQQKINLRLRPKFYPFVEPGVNGEITCFLCKGEGCRVCKQTGWLEIFGAGLIHPSVIEAGGLDPQEWGGFAFGMGLTRLAMLKYGIDDTRLFLGGDTRFLEQF